MEWLDGEEQHPSVQKISLEAIGRKAREIWEASEHSRELVVPTFSIGWAVKFRRRRLGLRDKQNTMRKRSHQEGKVITHLISKPILGKPHGEELPYSIRSVTDETRHETWKIVKPECDTSLAISRPPLAFMAKDDSCLPPEHLINLIQYNSWRALMSIKGFLYSATIQSETGGRNTSITHFPSLFCSGTRTTRAVMDISMMPESLYPTQLQMSYAHTSWIDIFPFPRFRDNLIMATGMDWVPERLMQDLFGEIFPQYTSRRLETFTPFVRDMSVISSSYPFDLSDLEAMGESEEIEDDDRYTSGRRCLINWGDPVNVASWEVTPGFVKRWGWTLNGCDDLIHSSNHWRALRDEDLIPWPDS